MDTHRRIAYYPPMPKILNAKAPRRKDAKSQRLFSSLHLCVFALKRAKDSNAKTQRRKGFFLLFAPLR